MTRVKICGLTSPGDAKQAVAAGADAIGLVFAPSPRRVSEAQAKKIINVLPTYIMRIGVFVNQEPGWIVKLADKLGLDRVQFHGQESGAHMRCFTKSRVIRAMRPKTRCSVPVNDPAPAAGAFLVDAFWPGVPGGTGKLSNWRFAKCLKKFGKTVILSGGLHAGNVRDAIHYVRPDMVDVSSGVEWKPGIKSADKMRQFILAVHEAG